MYCLDVVSQMRCGLADVVKALPNLLWSCLKECFGMAVRSKTAGWVRCAGTYGITEITGSETVLILPFLGFSQGRLVCL